MCNSTLDFFFCTTQLNPKATVTANCSCKMAKELQRCSVLSNSLNMDMRFGKSFNCPSNPKDFCTDDRDDYGTPYLCITGSRTAAA
mmetsp:Transcript_76517/g.135120  ORF Transcript_76517/g.135120 Transcript_76517/m.135120 type:complete len:86 (+) Transcript_76517:112-369(+)